MTTTTPTVKHARPFAGIAEGYVYFVKINALERNSFALDPFGTQLDAHKQIADWKKTARSTYIPIKHSLSAYKSTILNEIAAIGAKEWYVRFKQPTNFYGDGSIKLFYTE